MKISMAEEMRTVDKLANEKYGLPELLLMENAGQATAKAMAELLSNVDGKTICVLVGSGNNGGDALAASRYLANMGAKLRIFIAGEINHFSKSTATMYRCVKAMGLNIKTLSTDRDWDKFRFVMKFTDAILDGVLGTGFSGELRKNTLRLIEEVNAANKKVLAIDIPSGVEADTGKISTVAIKAARTITLGLPKVGHFFSPGVDCTGTLLVDNIGIPQTLLEENIAQILLDDATAATLLPPRPNAAHKGTCGKILVIAGSIGMTGAAALTSMAALKAGAGVVTLAVPASLNNLMEMKLTEVMTIPMPEKTKGILSGDDTLKKLLAITENYDAVLIGPGLSRQTETMELVRSFTQRIDKPIIMDADAIYAFRNHIDELKKIKQIPVLTPHLGEMAGLLNMSIDELRGSLLSIVRRTAKDYQCVLVVKSECTIVAYPDGDIFFSNNGNPGMATAGSGDVLTGTIAGLIKQTESAWTPLLGVYLHGLAGDIAYETKEDALIATDILENLPLARKKLRSFQQNIETQM